MEKTIKVTVLVFEKDMEAIDQIARERELLRSDIIREAIRKYVKKNANLLTKQ